METTAVTVVSQERTLLDMGHKEKLHAAAEIANMLANVIKKQRFFQVIQGKEYVRVEGWITLGSLLGVIPRERAVTETPDGSYIAEVDLVRADSGKVIGGASALCSIDEKRWGSADKYARRSMAVTRATGKAYRISFGWIVGLAGFETCNAEEMPDLPPVATKEVEVIEEKLVENAVFEGTKEQTEKLTSYLKSMKVPDDKVSVILTKMNGKTRDRLKSILAEALS